jgi:hypothetical protein
MPGEKEIMTNDIGTLHALTVQAAGVDDWLSNGFITLEVGKSVLQFETSIWFGLGGRTMDSNSNPRRQGGGGGGGVSSRKTSDIAKYHINQVGRCVDSFSLAHLPLCYTYSFSVPKCYN